MLNAAHGSNSKDKDGYDFYVNTKPSYYSKAEIEFLGVPAEDLLTCRISQYFKPSATYINNALKNKGKTIKNIPKTHTKRT